MFVLRKLFIGREEHVVYSPSDQALTTNSRLWYVSYRINIK